MMSILLGMITVALGSYGAHLWVSDFFSVLKGLLPVSFICGGLIAIFAGLSSFRKK